MIRRAVLSLLAMALGWVGGFLFFVVYMVSLTPAGRPTDVEATLVWTGFFIAVAWLIFVLPVVYWVPPSSQLLSPPTCTLAGAAYGLTVFLLVLGWWTGFWSEILYLIYALIVGAVAGLSFSLLVRSEALCALFGRRTTSAREATHRKG